MIRIILLDEDRPDEELFVEAPSREEAFRLACEAVVEEWNQDRTAWGATQYALDGLLTPSQSYEVHRP